MSDSDAAAACEIVAELIDELKVKHDALIREALFVGHCVGTRGGSASPIPGRRRIVWRRDSRRRVSITRSLYRRIEQAERPQKLHC